MAKLKNIFVMFMIFSLISSILLSIDSHAEVNMDGFFSLIRTAEVMPDGNVVAKDREGREVYFPKKFFEDNIRVIYEFMFDDKAYMGLITKDEKLRAIPCEYIAKNKDIIEYLMQFVYYEDAKEYVCHKQRYHHLRDIKLDFISAVRIKLFREEGVCYSREECRKKTCDLSVDDLEFLNYISYCISMECDGYPIFTKRYTNMTYGQLEYIFSYEAENELCSDNLKRLEKIMKNCLTITLTML